MLELTYFPALGRAGGIRFLLHDAGAEYTENHLTHESFGALKQRGREALPFGVVPALRDTASGLLLDQSAAILQYLGGRLGYAPADAEGNARALAFTLSVEDMVQRFAKFWSAKTEEDKHAVVVEFVDQTLLGRYLPLWDAHLGASDGPFLLGGDKPSYADFALFAYLYNMSTRTDVAYLSEKVHLDAFPRVHRFFGAMLARPNIAKYVEQLKAAAAAAAAAAASK